eukprot:TRINITY_DN1093_c2_g1_i1.p1 TRINITY_DN1093_c2_g1~~TRINITY_DN1093_c2_g1_i1.p1  ORF type:complete len:1151 (-),score=306.48 TRINITY_DN1093_c2_g1_i1:55-3507(-)
MGIIFFLIYVLSVSGTKYLSEPLCEGKLEDALCNVEQVDLANIQQLHSILKELENTTYFRLFHVDIDRPCQFWKKTSNNEIEQSCTSEPSHPSTPFSFDQEPSKCSLTTETGDIFSSHKQIDWRPPTDSIDQSISIEEDKALEFDGSAPSCEENLPTFWLDICSNIPIEGSKPINLQKNPERWTGYNGSKIWGAIYEENCFSRAGDIEHMCYEERVLYRLLSGMHSSINIHISTSYYPPKPGVNDEWLPNPQRFIDQFATHPERLKNLHFAFVVMLRTLHKAAPYFYNYEYSTGDSVEDSRTTMLVRRLLDSCILQSCSSVFTAFDESLLFQEGAKPSSASTLKRHFKSVFRNISSLLDCVTCQKCKLHGKLQLLGIGTALKILLIPEQLIPTALSREEVVSFFNTLSKFSDALSSSQKLTNMYWNEFSSYKDSRLNTGDPTDNNSSPDSTTDNKPIKESVTTTASSSTTSVMVNEPLLYSNDLVDVALQIVSDSARHGLIGDVDEEKLVERILLRDSNVLLLAKHYKSEPSKFIKFSLNQLQYNISPFGTGGGSGAGGGGQHQQQYDLVIIGGGLAGMTAALSVLDRGGRVAILEKEAFVGGNSAWASSGINAVGGPITGASGDSVEVYLSDTLNSKEGTKRTVEVGSSTDGVSDGDDDDGGDDDGGDNLLNVLVENSGEALLWIRDRLNLPFDKVGQLGGHSFARTYRPEKGMAGAELITTLQRMIAKYEGNGQLTLKKNSHVMNITRNEHGEVTGVLYKNQKTGSSDVIESANVLIATGGFSADRSNSSLLQLHRPDLVRLSTTNGPWAMGDGHKLASDLGAKLIDMKDVQVHPTAFLSSKHPEIDRKTLCAEILRGVGGILLTEKGHRFCNELGTRDYVVEKMIENDPTNHLKFIILLGHEASKAADHHVSLYTKKELLYSFKSLDEVAEWSGVDPEVLKKTILEYNESAENKKDQYNKTSFTNPPKLSDQVFYAGYVTPALHYCMGGVLIDEQGRVLDQQNNPIKGLYAAGEVTGGVHGKNRLGGNALTECVVFGRIVGEGVSITDNQSKELSDNNNKNNKYITTSNQKNREISIDELSLHNNEKSCWVAIYGKVYDFTNFLDEHPAGPEAILDQSGKDATEIFDSVHSLSMLDEFEPIGLLKKQ